MYDVKSNLVIGFHGCERHVRDALLLNPHDYKISQKPFDWLGHGLYFWENNYDRALQWASEKKERGKIKEPAVIGAVLQLGYCCDFLEHDAYNYKVLRNLDCAAIEFMQIEIFNRVKKDKAEKGYSEYKIFDSTRGVFIEGGPAFEGAGLFEKSHIQICIRNPNCIQGFFMPREEVDFMCWMEGKIEVPN